MNNLRRLLERLREWLFDQSQPANLELRIFEQNVYTMVNNICLSTDMKTLYLIDDGRAISFPLDQRSGILIGTLQGQLTAATAFELPKSIEEADPGMVAGSRSTTLVMSATKNKELVRLSTQKTAWSAVFHPGRMQLSLVGATEVEIRQADEEPVDYKAEIVSFDLKENTLNIRRIGELLLIRCLPNQIEKK
ncbi:MAG TPA: hypothetical protein VJ933_00990 [Phaeodactylibacter sp.]|nr:hypothetical protein [Phaeodactylibacter sp.]